MKNAQSGTSAALKDVQNGASLSDRESELLQRAGERVFALSRKVAAAEREIERLRSELQQSSILVDEVRRSRDVLSSQVMSLLNERDREYQERAELRRLLASLQSQMQSMLTTLVVRQPSPPQVMLGRPSPQRSGHVPMALLQLQGG
jgi:chromosome segregation ATPase